MVNTETDQTNPTSNSGDAIVGVKGHKIDVLPCLEGESGFVRLVDFMGNDLSIVRSARVSFDSDWRSEVDANEVLPKDVKLIQYLMVNNHTSPFESVQFVFEVKAPIFVFRQWHRHRTWAYNEVSARYTELDEGFYVPNPAVITTQSKSNKQARTTEQHPQAAEIRGQILDASYQSYAIYRKLLEQDTPRELARTVLPVNTYSRMFAAVNLHNLLHFLQLRLHLHAQYEIRVYAAATLELITPIVPVTVESFKLQYHIDQQLEKIRKEILATMGPTRSVF